MAREMVGEADQPQAKKHKHKHTENTDNVAENAEDTVNATENIAKRVEPYGYAVIYTGQVMNGSEGSCAYSSLSCPLSLSSCSRRRG